MNTRIKIIGILFAFFYFFIIGETVFTDIIPSLVSGFKEGWSEAKENQRGHESKVSESFGLEVVPKNGNYTFPTSFDNLKIGGFIQADLKTLYVTVSNPIKLGTWFIIATVFKFIFALAAVFLLVYIPIQSYKTIRSIVKNEIFDLRTITRLRRIGYALLIIFGCNVYYVFVDYLASRQMISLKDYDIIFSVKSEYIFLLFGLITLLFAEILKISHTMKEEQDLTI